MVAERVILVKLIGVNKGRIRIRIRMCLFSS